MIAACRGIRQVEFWKFFGNFGDEIQLSVAGGLGYKETVDIKTTMRKNNA